MSPSPRLAPVSTRSRPSGRVLFGVLTILWVATVLWVNGLPGSDLPRVGLGIIPHKDKIVHFTMYAVMGLLLWRTVVPRRRGERLLVRHPVILCFVVTALIGIIDELHQIPVEGRSCDVADMLANAVGAATAVTIGWMHDGARLTRHPGGQGKAYAGPFGVRDNPRLY